MKKTITLISLMLGMVLVLAACSGAGVGGTGTADDFAADDDALFTQSPLTGTVETTLEPLPGDDVMEGTEEISPAEGLTTESFATSTLEATRAVTPTPVVATSEATATAAAASTPLATLAVTAVVPGTGPLTDTQGLADTGRPIQLSLCSMVTNFGVFAQDGEQIGETADLILDVSRGRILFLVVEVEGKFVPVPWQMVSIRPPAVSGSDTGTGVFLIGMDNDFEIAINRSDFDNAPTFSMDELPTLDIKTWEADIQTFWGKYMPGGSLNLDIDIVNGDDNP